jgi:hypothetical protein
MHLHPSLKHSMLFSALALALAGCGGGGDPDARVNTRLAGNDGAAPVAMNEQDMINEISSSLQACSYDGAPVRVDPQGMSGGDPGAGAQVVAEIMKYTGLPQNFEVMPHPDVPNAAAVILIGDDRLPHRVIAYNEKFMADVRAATASNDWAPVSIMAHEIGHHLSGHTMQPGGSQPPTELEADKFSGFVLYKMGAVLADAQKAMNTLVPETDGPTHPGRSKRVRAIEEGWKQACTQQSSDCGGMIAAAAATATQAPAGPALQPEGAAVSPVGDGDTTATTSAPLVSAGNIDLLPLPDAAATPGKFGKFVIDELGVLDPATRTRVEKDMYDLADRHQVEIVTIVAKSLHGMDPDDYAHAMMRQLRVGKLDVGNGAVLVAAPNENKVGVAMGAGVMLEMRDYIDLEKDRLMGFIDIGLPYCKGICNADQTELLTSAAEHIAHDVGAWDFNIRFQSLAELLARFDEIATARMNGQETDPDQDPTWRKITRIEGRLVSRDPASGDQAKWLNDVHAQSVGPAMQVRSTDGRNLLIYADPKTESLMTAKLEEGKSYVFIARESSLSQNPDDTLSFDLLSFDATR